MNEKRSADDVRKREERRRGEEKVTEDAKSGQKRGGKKS